MTSRHERPDPSERHGVDDCLGVGGFLQEFEPDRPVQPKGDHERGGPARLLEEFEPARSPPTRFQARPEDVPWPKTRGWQRLRDAYEILFLAYCSEGTATWKSYRGLAEVLRVGRSTAWSYVRRLEALGLIEVEHPGSPGLEDLAEPAVVTMTGLRPRCIPGQNPMESDLNDLLHTRGVGSSNPLSMVLSDHATAPMPVTEDRWRWKREGSIARSLVNEWLKSGSVPFQAAAMSRSIDASRSQVGRILGRWAEDGRATRTDGLWTLAIKPTITMPTWDALMNHHHMEQQGSLDALTVLEGTVIDYQVDTNDSFRRMLRERRVHDETTRASWSKARGEEEDERRAALPGNILFLDFLNRRKAQKVSASVPHGRRT